MKHETLSKVRFGAPGTIQLQVLHGQFRCNDNLQFRGPKMTHHRHSCWISSHNCLLIPPKSVSINDCSRIELSNGRRSWTVTARWIWIWRRVVDIVHPILLQQKVLVASFELDLARFSPRQQKSTNTFEVLCRHQSSVDQPTSRSRSRKLRLLF